MFSLHFTMHRSFKTLPSLTLEASVLSATGPVDLGLSAARLFAACVTSVVAGPAKSMIEQIRAVLGSRYRVQGTPYYPPLLGAACRLAMLQDVQSCFALYFLSDGSSKVCRMLWVMIPVFSWWWLIAHFGGKHQNASSAGLKDQPNFVRR